MAAHVCSIFYDVVKHLRLRYTDTLNWDPQRLTLDRLREYSRAVKAADGGDRVWGYIDGTLRKVCRPGEDQQVYYTGYKKHWAFKFQSIVTPDGMISSLNGPYAGPKADWTIWHESNLEARLREVSNSAFVYIY